MRFKLFLFIFLVQLLTFQVYAESNSTLVGWAELKKGTFSNGPKSAHFSRYWVPAGSQAVQGFSAVISSKNPNEFYFLVDNSAGFKNQAAGSWLRVYKVKIQFANSSSPKHFVEVLSNLTLADKERKLPFTIQADYEYYYNQADNNSVDSQTKAKRFLTGADFDPESIAIGNDDSIWVGEEYGPFILHFNKFGNLIDPPFQIKDISSIDNPLSSRINKPTLGASSGFEAMAISPSGNMLYPMLEKKLISEKSHSLRLFQFDTIKKEFLSGYFLYPLDINSSEVRDIVAINNEEFLAIEQNANTDINAYKRVYLFTKKNVVEGGELNKFELIDLMQINDPMDLNHDGSTSFSFPKLTIESIAVLDEQTILIANDNNFEESTQFLKIRIKKPLNLVSSKHLVDESSAWEKENSLNAIYMTGYHSLFGWITIVFYLVAIFIAFNNARVTYRINTEFSYWLFITFSLMLIFLYRHLTLSYFIVQSMRDIFIEYGWYADRRVIQLIVVKILAGLCLLTFVSLLIIFPKFFMRHLFSLAGLILLGSFKILEMISYHHIENLLFTPIRYMRTYHGVEIFLICLLILGLVTENKTLKQKLSL